MQDLWIKIDELRVKSYPDFEDPWDSYDEEMREVWKEITKPTNITVLQERLDSPLNPYAFKVTKRALKDCLLRMKEAQSWGF